MNVPTDLPLRRQAWFSRRRLAALLAGPALASGAAGQTAPAPTYQPQPLQLQPQPLQPSSALPGPGSRGVPTPVDPNVGDVNPLQVSNRMVPMDLRQPTGWDRVYRLNGDPRLNGGRGLFARIDGGIAAVFPWSTYEMTPRGSTLAAVPPGTTYYIGGVPKSMTAPLTPSTDHSFNYLDLSARPAPPQRPVQQLDTAAQSSARETLRAPAVSEPAGRAPDAPSVWNNESYRRTRLAELLSRADPAPRPPERPAPAPADPAK